MRQAKLPVGFAGWLQDYHDASNWVHPFMHTEGAYAGNQGFAPEMQQQFDDLIAQGVAETDPAKRVEIYTQLQNLAMENAIDVFLFQATGRTYMNKAISGWFYNPLAPGHYYYTLTKGAPPAQ
jgi:peptide/nickel transport system substrate-binding protein